jgi:DNA invertase Pin-like site-specific DNA recombinase
MKHYDVEFIQDPDMQLKLRATVYDIIKDRYLSYSEVAREIGLNRNTFYGWLTRKDLVGSYINVCRIMEWVDKNKKD